MAIPIYLNRSMWRIIISGGEGKNGIYFLEIKSNSNVSQTQIKIHVRVIFLLLRPAASIRRSNVRLRNKKKVFTDRLMWLFYLMAVRLTHKIGDFNHGNENVNFHET